MLRRGHAHSPAHLDEKWGDARPQRRCAVSVKAQLSWIALEIDWSAWIGVYYQSLRCECVLQCLCRWKHINTAECDRGRFWDLHVFSRQSRWTGKQKLHPVCAGSVFVSFTHPITTTSKTQCTTNINLFIHFINNKKNIIAINEF